MITCVVGSGGKTTLIHKLKEQYINNGKRVFVTTTTHMHLEKDTLITDNADEIIEYVNKNNYAFAGTECYDKTKISGLSAETFNKVCTHADEVLIEADGSRQLPIKLPSKNEPVITDNCDHIIIVTSLLALDKPAKDVIHRLSDAMSLLNITPDTIVTPVHIQTLLRKGYIEPLMNKNCTKEIQVTTDGSLYQRALASLLKADMDVSILKPEWFSPKPILFICGAGHVSKELAAIATLLEFRIYVMDYRPELVSKERFPYAEKLICSSFEELSAHLEKDSFYVVVTPGHIDDYTCVNQILSSNQYSYLGMIGSRKKVATTFETLRNNGFSDEQINSVHAPIGLSIGAVTPAEIAISILAEIIEIKNKLCSASISSELLNSTKSGTLCVIVDKKGATPRDVGSMMLVTEHEQIDTLGGGAIENQVVIDAKSVTTPCIKEYNLGPADSAKLGMICGGTNKILFIPLSHQPY